MLEKFFDFLDVIALHMANLGRLWNWIERVFMDVGDIILTICLILLILSSLLTNSQFNKDLEKITLKKI